MNKAFITILFMISIAYPSNQMTIQVKIINLNGRKAGQQGLSDVNLPSFNESEIEQTIIKALQELVAFCKLPPYPITSNSFRLYLPPAPNSPWGLYRYINEAGQFRKKLKEQLPTHIDGYQLLPYKKDLSIDADFKEQMRHSKIDLLLWGAVCTFATCIPIVACTESKLTPLIAMPCIALGTKCARKTTSFLQTINIYILLFLIARILSLNSGFIPFIALFTAFSGFWHFKKAYKRWRQLDSMKK